jgi:hypothetical protein
MLVKWGRLGYAPLEGGVSKSKSDGEMLKGSNREIEKKESRKVSERHVLYY